MSHIINIFDQWFKNPSPSGAGEGVLGENITDFTKALDHLQETLFQVSPTGKWLYLSKKWGDSTGYSPGNCLGKRWLNNIHPQDHDICQNYIQRVAKGHPDTLIAPIRILTSNNELRWMEVRANTLQRNISGEFSIIGTLTDISDEKAENERQLASYRTLASLIGNIPGMLYRCRNNRDWTMEFVSPRCLELTGYNAEYVINNNTAWNDMIHPEAREYVWRTIQTAVQNQQSFELTYRIITREGDEKWVWERGRGNFAKNGELLGLEGLITDITDNKRQLLRIERDSLFDPVTKLATQHLFFNRIQHAIELAEAQQEHAFSVVMLHISQHSNAADGLDPHANDLLAREIGSRLKSTLDSSATISRLRDNEFGILLEHNTADSNYSVTRILRPLQANLKSPVKLDHNIVYIKSSIGVAIYARQTSNSEILQDASRAMNQARELGGGKIEFADTEQNRQMALISGTESEMRKALEEGELELICQSLNSSGKSHRPRYEIKLSWHHPRRGILLAESFSPYIEDPELIQLLGKFILSNLPNQLEKNIQHDNPAEVYIHGLDKQIFSPDRMSSIGDALKFQEHSNISFIVEIDAQYLVNAAPHSLENLRHLQAQGAGIAVIGLAPDSPCTELRTIPGLIAVKIYVPETAQNITSCLATMAYYNALGVEVIIEGTASSNIKQAMENAAISYRPNPQGNV